MQKQYLSLKRQIWRSMGVKLVLCLGVVGLSASRGEATSYDMSETPLQAQAQAKMGAGPGFISGGTTGVPARTNVSFSDFGVVPDADPRSNDATHPADLLPINHQNTVTDNTGNQLQINSYASSQIKPNEATPQISGTSPTQAPQVIRGQSTLSPTTQALQSNYSPTALIPIPSGQYSFGFRPQLPSMYNGPYANTVPNQTGYIPPVSGLNNLLPPTSLGSVDFNITSK